MVEIYRRVIILKPLFLVKPVSQRHLEQSSKHHSGCGGLLFNGEFVGRKKSSSVVSEHLRQADLGKNFTLRENQSLWENASNFRVY